MTHIVNSTSHVNVVL